MNHCKCKQVTCAAGLPPAYLSKSYIGLHLKILYFYNSHLCPTQPNMTFTIVQQYDYAKHDYILF